LGNTASGKWATIAGGYNITVTGRYAAVGGGMFNTAGIYATVGGGYSNTAGGVGATVGGGYYNTASGIGATVGGGSFNLASGQYATVPGGYWNTAQGDYSFAAGRRAKANNPGCFVWGDSTNDDVTCSTNDRTVFRSSGGCYIYTRADLSIGVHVAAGGSSWTSPSDRSRKENFRPVDTQALLENLATIEISTWNYKGQDPSIRHIGPMAQDFNNLLPDLGGEGEDYINSLDADGVTLAAIQGLYERMQALEAENAALRAENEAQQAQIDDLAARLEALESRTASSKTLLWPGLLLGGLVLAWAVRRQEGWGGGQ
jgi:hypothetical protein